MPTLGKASGEQMPEKLINRARNGAARLEYAARLRSSKQFRRAMRAVTFAISLKAFRGDPLYALQGHSFAQLMLPPTPNVAPPAGPLAITNISSSGIDD